jgi:curved DNA-binding protein CbpA
MNNNHAGFLKLEAMLGHHRPWREEDLKRQHRDFVRSWHPDRCGHPDAHIRSVQANHARDRLKELVRSKSAGVVQSAAWAGQQEKVRTRSSASPGWEDKRSKGGALWWCRSVPAGTRLPPEWHRASTGQRPGRPWTKRPGEALDLLHELDLWLAERAAA